MRHLILLICMPAYAHPLTCCLLPPPLQSICIIKYILKSILKDAYSTLSHRAVTYDDVAQEIKVKKVLNENKQFWGTPQVMHIKWECTGSFSIIKRDYMIDYVVVDKIN